MRCDEIVRNTQPDPEPLGSYWARRYARLVHRLKRSPRFLWFQRYVLVNPPSSGHAYRELLAGDTRAVDNDLQPTTRP